MIEFKDVTVCYEPQKRHPVRSLDGLNLHIARGDWVFLVGPSGAGKSSLLKLIFAGTRSQSGSIIVDGQEISALSAREIPALRRKIGIVFQDFQLLNEKTAWENVAFTLRVIGAPQSVIVREVPRALETVGLTHRAEAFPHELSGGEQQRIAIARAIVNDPKILLCDEPTGNLDPQTAREVGELLTRINRERGTTIVMATHDGSFVNDLKRRVVRLKAGRVVSDQNPGTYGEGEDLSGEVTPFDKVLPMSTPKPRPVVEKPVEAPEPPYRELLVPPLQTTTPILETTIETVIEKTPEPEKMPVAEVFVPETPAPRPPAPVQESPAPVTTPALEVTPTPASVPTPTPAAPPTRVHEPPIIETPFLEDPIVETPPVTPPAPIYEPPVATPPAPASPPPVTPPPPVPTPAPVAPPEPAPRPPQAPINFDDFPAPRPMARRIAPAQMPPPRQPSNDE
jgi:cell division transport system ATP-binding protein